jgi:large subunit ribosomal protein L5
MMGTLKEQYENQLRAELQEKLGITNVMEIPKIEKIVLNMGLGDAVQNPKVVEKAAQELTMISGQKAVVTRAKKSIATFKLRAGMPIGARVTLRKDRMYDFLSKLINVALPRVRDFRGVSAKGFDGRGNFSMGVSEHIIFPEIDYDKIDQIRGLNVTIVTTQKPMTGTLLAGCPRHAVPEKIIHFRLSLETNRFRRMLWQKNHSLPRQAVNRNSACVPTIDVRCVVGPGRITENSACAGSASANWLRRVKLPV